MNTAAAVLSALAFIAFAYWLGRTSGYDKGWSDCRMIMGTFKDGFAAGRKEKAARHGRARAMASVNPFSTVEEWEKRLGLDG